MLVKICGILTESAARTAAESGADFIGFIFTKSKRQIDINEARRISENLPNTVKKVGVFVNQPIDEIKAIAEKVGLDVIQLHGDEKAEVAEALPYEIIKAFPATKERLREARDYPADYILIDTPSNEARGGTGIVSNWEWIRDADIDRKKLILAGGLTSENVQSGIAAVGPIGVDVSSGVESNGKKDESKIRQFIDYAKKREDARNDKL